MVADMAGRNEYRTITLQLSENGVDLVLDCHTRLAKCVHMLVPYRATLSVSICLLDRCDMQRIADEVDRIDGRCFHGGIPAFLPIYPQLARKAAEFGTELGTEQFLFSKVPARKVHLTALYRMLTIHHHSEIIEAYRRVNELSPTDTKPSDEEG